MMFCTLVCAVFDKTTHCLELVNGGHTLPVCFAKVSRLPGPYRP
jgi:serine phosphatase RsbU (regulator of sigma subunit)